MFFIYFKSINEPKANKIETETNTVARTWKRPTAAGFIHEVSRRYITMGHNSSLLERVKALAPKYENAYPIPKKVLPKWITWLISPLVDKVITRKL